MPRPNPPIVTREIVLILIATFAALIVREWVRRLLLENAVDPALAKHLSWLLCVPVWLALSGPVLVRNRSFILSILSLKPGSARLILLGAIAGVACRVLWWAYATFIGALDLAGNATESGQFSWRFSCPPLVPFTVGFVTMAVLTPLIEELFHRGFIQTYFARFGTTAGVLVSALLFTVLHSFDSWPFVFLLGILFAIQFHRAETLWFPIATHAVYNGLIQLDWVCVSLQWQPAESSVRSVTLFGLSTLTAVAALIVIALTIRAAPARR